MLSMLGFVMVFFFRANLYDSALIKNFYMVNRKEKHFDEDQEILSCKALLDAERKRGMKKF